MRRERMVHLDKASPRPHQFAGAGPQTPLCGYGHPSPQALANTFFEDLPDIHRRRESGAHNEVLAEGTRGKRPAPSRTDRLVRFGFHLNDNDREMTNLCRGARSVPMSIQMNADLPSLDQLRSNAAECIRLAEAARTSQHKSLFIEMADRWLTLAEHAAREDRLNGGSLFRDR
jgi:hypothetical protein